MQLTLFSDYSLRVLLYLGVHRDQLVSVPQIATAYRISQHHLVKVARVLVRLKLVEAVRGRGGGLRLKKAPAEINLGWLIRQTEPHMNLVECFDRVRGTCPITPACQLKHVLGDAQKQFLAVLDAKTLADVLTRQDKLIDLWAKASQ